MFELILYQPEIPPNAGNVLRLCANTGVRLHLVEPLGFRLDDRSLVRAGLDYGDARNASIYKGWNECRQTLTNGRMFALTTRGSHHYSAVRYRAGDAFVFGPETRGLPAEVLDSVPETQHLRLPMVAGSRSLNLANACAVVIYEAWRQLGFPGGR